MYNLANVISDLSGVTGQMIVRPSAVGNATPVIADSGQPRGDCQKKPPNNKSSSSQRKPPTSAYRSHQPMPETIHPEVSGHIPGATELSGPHPYLFNLILRHQLRRNRNDVVLGVPRYGRNPPSVPSVVKLIDVDAA